MCMYKIKKVVKILKVQLIQNTNIKIQCKPEVAAEEVYTHYRW